MTLHMPSGFRGFLFLNRVTCGICRHCHWFTMPALNRADAKKVARRDGWTWRCDLGWVCACRHQCENLNPKLEPRFEETRAHARRRSSRPESPKRRKMRTRRNRTEGAGEN